MSTLMSALPETERTRCMENITALQLNNPVSASFSPEEMLSFITSSSNIDLSRVRNDMIKAEIEKVIETTHTSPITQGPDGRWRTSVYEGKKRRLIAKKSLDDLKLEVYCFYTGVPKEDVFKEHTIESLYPRWKAYKSLHTDAKTSIMRIESEWKNHYLDDEIITIPITQLDKLTIDIWAHKLIRDNDLTKKQYYNRTMIARQILDYAVELHLIPVSPFSQFRIDTKLFKKVSKKPSETQVFNREEQASMEALAWKDFEEKKYPVNQLVPLGMIFQFQTGLRIGELCALKHEDVDGDKLYVRRMFRAAANEIVDDTKGSFGERTVILTDKANEILKAVDERKKDLGVSNEFIFSLNDKPASYNALKDLYPSYCNKLDIISRSSHKSRKTYVSSLYDGDVNINTIRELVGHKDERTTLSCYVYDRNSDAEKKAMIQKALTY